MTKLGVNRIVVLFSVLLPLIAIFAGGATAYQCRTLSPSFCNSQNPLTCGDYLGQGNPVCCVGWFINNVQYYQLTYTIAPNCSDSANPLSTCIACNSYQKCIGETYKDNVCTQYVSGVTDCQSQWMPVCK